MRHGHHHKQGPHGTHHEEVAAMQAARHALHPKHTSGNSGRNGTAHEKPHIPAEPDTLDGTTIAGPSANGLSVLLGDDVEIGSKKKPGRSRR